MNKKYYLLAIAVLFFIFILYPNKTIEQTSDSNINKSTDSIQLGFQPILSSDLNKRLANYNNINLNQEDPKVYIFLDDNSSQLKQVETLFEIKKNFSLEPFDDLFKDDLNSLTISIAYNDKTQAISSFIDQIKSSYQLSPPQENKLVFVGCMLLSRWVALRSQQHDDYIYPFHYTYEITKNADLAIGNLETPFAKTGPYTDLDTIFRGDPGLIEGLVYSGFDLVNLANNHFGDSQLTGMQLTFDLLDENNIKYFGAGINQTESRKAHIVDLNGVKYAFLGYSEGTFTPNSYASDDEYAGLNLMDINTISQDVILAKEQADFVIVSIHAGVEYHHNPSQFQIDFAHKAIDAGADMIYGHHPHVTQGIEYYKNKPIFYSLGNFSMDQLERDTQQGYILKTNNLFNQVINIELIPYHIYDYSQPKIVEDEEADEIIADIYDSSKVLQSN